MLTLRKYDYPHEQGVEVMYNGKNLLKKMIFSGLLIFIPFVPITSQANSSTSSGKDIFSNSSLNEKEAQLQRIARNLDNYQFKLLRAGNTTPNAWIVKNKQGQNVALLKCTSGNNYARGEIAAYYIGRHLDFPLYPVTVAAEIKAPMTQRLNISPQICALKEWVNNFAMLYWKAQANVPKIVAKGEFHSYQQKNTFISGTGFKRKIADTIMCQNDLRTLAGINIQLSTGTKIRNGDPLINGKPTLFTSDDVSLLAISTQLSNLMVLDAVFGNGDRFPGGNLEFRSKNNQSIKGKNQVIIINPQLSSIDTGLSFKGWRNSWGRQEMQYYLRRFDPVMIEKLKKFLNELDHLTPADFKGEWRYLNFYTQKNEKISAAAYLKENIKWVLKFVKDEQKHQIKPVIPNQSVVCRQIFIEAKP